METVRSGVRVLVAVAMIAVGILHFMKPQGFVDIVPKTLPHPLLLVHVSGFFEIAGGVGILVPRTRRAAGFGLIALYVAVFPANVNMAVNGIQPDGMQVSSTAAWVRLPFQLVFIAVAWWVAVWRGPGSASATARASVSGASAATGREDGR
ncbi:MAG: DoxX family membrane protein [Polyangiaceae bacterium]